MQRNERCGPAIQDNTKGRAVSETRAHSRVEGDVAIKAELPLNAGRLSLNLVCTLRYRPSKNSELLEEPSDLSRWLFEAKAVNQLTSATPAQLDNAKRLRKAILEIAFLIDEGKSRDRRAVAVINEFAAFPQPKLQLDFRSWQPKYLTDSPIDAGLSAVARDAIDLFTGPQSKLIRTCAEPSCRMLVGILLQARGGVGVR